MPPVPVDPRSVCSFANAAELEGWLGEHHARRAELWLKIHKKGSGMPSVTYAEALDVALAWGWIDGLKKSFDELSFLQRFTPRRPKSGWSQRNREHVDRLTKAGRMRASGLAEVEAAKADGRWAAAYAPPSAATYPADLVAAIEAVPAARATFARLDSVNRYALIYRLGRLKTEAGRARAIERFVQMLAQGRTPHPLPGSAADRAGAVLARAGASAADSPPRASKRAKTSKRVKVSKRAKASKRAKVSRGGE